MAAASRCFAGSPSSHVAMLARARGVPMIVGLSRADLSHHQEALLDADNGTLVASPDAATTAVFLANHRGRGADPRRGVPRTSRRRP